ncbi:uncharacterized protein PHACADRAFT_248390 [Phanerochaete carnosa HHB-10118-sp]|uniref:Raptor N-terminal CASPase-like domain-containing protein n=1 Tax=Phanerochaete carnosa (strain HHB-10118-sp) TaxID=650164 RepID=K5VF55_PHACS|nr:uncharacterized protein PHACADRAFT_248390 [Phanerochaete carnosa HHB-10118-sp]EKM61656.1 hypothetical protein PHACADRAFT_248390 [Phanerochaete carnosa HHB-10118-sp]
MPSYKALEIIGTNLRHQFEGLSPKIMYKAFLDPSDNELREGCIKARNSAKDDAVLFHYNGHGVPKPTPSGELWCFNKNYTQYIPMSLQELQRCLGTPCVYIWDCSSAGHLLNNFITFAKRLDEDTHMNTGSYPDPPFQDAIQLASCLADEQLPTCPELPADLFTSCLTSPIDIALRWFIMNNQLPNNITNDMVMQLPGDLKDRRTPLGELNWIFTAITDTIAWTTFPREIFTRLYRSDLLVASLFRNFLLAERIMKNYHCTPHTSPALPATNTHPLWASWDLAVDACLRQLPELLMHAELPPNGQIPASLTTSRRRATATALGAPGNEANSEKQYTYIPSRFFSDQLTAFEVWISRGGSALTKRGPLSLPLSRNQSPTPDQNGAATPYPPPSSSDSTKDLVPRKPPDQLPIVLQVLLSQPHRLRALILLSQFVDLGPWAVHLALTIGIFPYISRLLQAAGQDLRPVLIFIWARILAVDPTCQVDLYNGQGYRYFANVLAIPEDPRAPAIPNGSEHKAMCAFILSAIARDYPPGQRACWSEHVFDACYEGLDDSDFLLRQWSALCVAQIWDQHDELRVWGVDKGTQDKLIALLSDDSPEVRGAALYSLGTFLGASGSADLSKLGGGGSGTMHQLEERIHFRMEVAVVTGAALAIKEDASPMVRKELLVVISCLVKEWRGYFIVCAWLYWEEERRQNDFNTQQEEDVAEQAVAEWLGGFEDDNVREENRVWLSSFFTIFSVLLELSCDPYQEVATNAQTVVDYVIALLLESPFTRLENTSLSKPPPNALQATMKRRARSRVPSHGSQTTVTQAPPSQAARPGLPRSDTMSSGMTATSMVVSNTLKRTSSFANALRHLAGGLPFPSSDGDGGRSSPKPQPQNISQLEVPGVSRPPSPNLNYAQYTSPYSRPSSPSHDYYLPQTPPSPGLSTRSDETPRPPVEYMASDVIEALMEEDMERLRARRRAGTRSKQHGHHHGTGVMSSPSGSTFSVDSVGSSIILGLGTGVGIRDVLPLKSRFYDWCCEYFKEPQMRQPEPDEPGSMEYNYQVWRQQRNENIINETRAQADVADNCRWDRPVASIPTSVFPTQIAFHAYDPHMVVTNEQDLILVYDWLHKRKVSQFFNGNPLGSSITSLHFINEEIGGIILTGAADGIVRMYRNYDPDLSGSPVQMVSSFRGLNEVLRMKRGAGLITEWKQQGGTLLVGGDSRMVRVWDAHTESSIMDIDTQEESPITSMKCEDGNLSVFVASFGDGVMKVFDRRLEEDEAVVRHYPAHSSWVQKVKWHPTIPAQFVSASVDGDVKLFDIRGSQQPVYTWDLFPQGLSAFDVHDLTGVFAATSSVSVANWRTQRTAVHSLSQSGALSTLSTVLTVPPPRDALSPYIMRTSALAFHPREMVFAVGSLDGHVRVMGCKLPP